MHENGKKSHHLLAPFGPLMRGPHRTRRLTSTSCQRVVQQGKGFGDKAMNDVWSAALVRLRALRLCGAALLLVCDHASAAAFDCALAVERVQQLAKDIDKNALEYPRCVRS